MISWPISESERGLHNENDETGPFSLAIALVGARRSRRFPERIVDADREPSNWLTYAGNYQSHRYSPLIRSPARTSRG